MGWNMRRGLGSLATLLAVAVVGTAAVTPAQAEIAKTKHNLTTGTIAGQNTFTGSGPDAGNTEICVFCHTPHGADTGASVPLWNRKLQTEANFYTTYDNLKTSTLDGKTMAVGSVSLACLSCHDGQTAMSTVINAPGSGRYDPAGFAMTGAWTGNNVNADGTLKTGVISNIGKDLQNDHPIGIQYAGGGIYNNGGTSTGTGKDVDFKAPANATLNSTLVWWVDTEAAGAATGIGSRQKTDMILYTRTFETKDQPFVECASCHDPHSENTTFLRISNAGSAVCLACHIK